MGVCCGVGSVLSLLVQTTRKDTAQPMGCSRKCAHATMARMGNKKWPHVWLDRCGCTVVWSARAAQAFGTDLAHGSSARTQRTVVAMRQNRGVDPRPGGHEGRAAGHSADRRRRLTRHRPEMTHCNIYQRRVEGSGKTVRFYYKIMPQTVISAQVEHVLVLWWLEKL